MKNNGISSGNFAQRLAMLKLIADELPVVVLIHKTDNLNVIYINQPGLDRLGISREDLHKVYSEQFLTTKVTRMMEELSFYRKNSPLFLKLTKREKEVLACIALGMNSGEISNRLFISPTTVDTHRRNLRSKLNLRNNYDTVRFAQAYNLV